MSEPERRSDAEIREMIDRVAERAAEMAVRKLSDLAPWDLSTHEGRERMRTTFNHADQLERGCSSIKKTGGQKIVATATWFLIFSVIAGTLWVLGFDPSKIKLLGGKP